MIARLLPPADRRRARGASTCWTTPPLSRSRPGFDLVVTKDAIVEGVHFLDGDPPDLVARKLLRVNLSDLAAKGAEPFGYFLAVAWPADYGWSERRGLRRAAWPRTRPTFGLTCWAATPSPRPGRSPPA